MLLQVNRVYVSWYKRLTTSSFHFISEIIITKLHVCVSYFLLLIFFRSWSNLIWISFILLKLIFYQHLQKPLFKTTRKQTRQPTKRGWGSKTLNIHVMQASVPSFKFDPGLRRETIQPVLILPNEASPCRKTSLFSFKSRDGRTCKQPTHPKRKCKFHTSIDAIEGL